MKNILIVLAVLLLVASGGSALYLSKKHATSPVACTLEAKICPDGSTVSRTGPNCEFSVCSEKTPPTLPSGGKVSATSTSSLNQKISVNGVIITTLEVMEDSRCPVDVQCIQAGTVRLRVMLQSRDVKEEMIINLGTASLFMKKSVELVRVFPVRSSKQPISDGSYRFTFSIKESVSKNKGTLSGTMTIGPVCPVERVDAPCTPSPEMYAARKIFVYASDKKTLITTMTPNSQGKFTASLVEGDYFIDMEKSRVGSIVGVPKMVTVAQDVTTFINISVDTGIRLPVSTVN